MPHPTVRVEPVETGMRSQARWFVLHAWLKGGGRESPGVRVTFFRVAERKSPKKGRPYSLRPHSPCGRVGQPVVLGRGVRCGTRCALRATLRQPQRVSSRCVCPAAHTHPTPCAPRRILKGWGSRTSTRAIASLGPTSRAQAPRAAQAGPSAAMARMAVRRLAVWLPTPCGCACVGAVAGWHARRSAHASCSSSPQLFERSCKAAQ